MDIIVLKRDATEEEMRHVVKKLESRGLKVNISAGTERTIIGVIGDTSKVTEEEEDAIRAASKTWSGYSSPINSPAANSKKRIPKYR
jgi:hypothetical protein